MVVVLVGGRRRGAVVGGLVVDGLVVGGLVVGVVAGGNVACGAALVGGRVVGGAVVDGGGELGWGRESRWRTVVVVRHCPGHVGAAVVPVDRLLCRPMPSRGMAAG